MFLFKLYKFKKNAKSIRLTPNEKLTLKNNLVAFMHDHPVRNETEARHILTQTGQSVFSFLNHKYMFASLIALIIVSLTGGVSYAAQDSLPGSPLYPVKTLTEEVRAAATLSAHADAEWDARRVERRLEEANTLAAEGKLTTSTEAMLAAKIERHIAQAQDKIERLEEKNKDGEAAKVLERLHASLALHQQVLTNLNSAPVVATSTSSTIGAQLTATSSPREVRGNGHALLNQLLQLGKKTEKIQERIENSAKVQEHGDEAAQHKIDEAGKHIAEVKKFVAEKKSLATAEVITAAEAKLSTAEATLATAKTQFDQKLYVQAFVSAGTAAVQAQEAKILIATSLNLPKVQNIQKALLKDIKEVKKDVLKDIREEKKENRENASSTVSTSTAGRIIPRLKARIELEHEINQEVREKRQEHR